MSVNERNFAAIEQALNKTYRELSEAVGRIQSLERNYTILQAELANQKQLTAHVLGRGMGSTERG